MCTTNKDWRLCIKTEGATHLPAPRYHDFNFDSCFSALMLSGMKALPFKEEIKYLGY